jgi:hypothetical protein
MLKIDPISGDLHDDQLVLGKFLTHEAFLEKSKGFELVYEDNRLEGLEEQRYRREVELTSSVVGIITVFFFQHKISHLHVNDISTATFKIETDEDEQQWWELHAKWIPQAREYVASQLGTPHQVMPSKLLDEHYLAPSAFLKLLEDWTYQFSWGRVGTSYVSDDLCYRIWIGYSSR